MSKRTINNLQDAFFLLAFVVSIYLLMTYADVFNVPCEFWSYDIDKASKK